MPTWKLTIEYDGSRYSGWQDQTNARTRAGELRQAAEEIFGRAFEIGARLRPEVMLLVAREVAQRLQGLVGYVVELKVQYDDGPGLEAMDEILARLSVWRSEAIEHASEPDPDPQR